MEQTHPQTKQHVPTRKMPKMRKRTTPLQQRRKHRQMQCMRRNTRTTNRRKSKNQRRNNRHTRIGSTKMTEHKPEWPEIGDLVIATIETVTDYGAYAKLDEYNKRGLLHVSEISSSWIRNIRDFVRENQKVVLKVLRVDTEKGHIDLSLRRVTKREKIEKILSWKKYRKAEALLRGVAEKVGLSEEEVLQKVAQSVVSNVVKAGGQGTFRREK